MSIKISNFGKIKEADIRVDGLTVIAGKNDTGKSTIGKSLYSVIKSVVDFPLLYDKISAVPAILNLMPILFELGRTYSGNANDECYIKISSIRDELIAVFANGNDISINSFNKFYDKLTEYLFAINQFVDKFGAKDEQIKEIKAIEADLRKETDDNEKFKRIVSYIFSMNFQGNLNNSVNSDEAKIEYTIGLHKIANILINSDVIKEAYINITLKSNSFRDATLIESPLYMEEGHNSSNSFVTDLKDKISKAKELLPIKSDNEIILRQIDMILDGGKFSCNKQNNNFEYRVSDKAKALKIANIASGSKSYGLLYILLKTGVLFKDSLLILDEPENHLHPEWQIKYAEILALLVKEGFYILLTSHSPTFIHALASYSKKYNKDREKINFYLAEKIDGENYSSIKNVNNNIDEIFENLNAPTDVLYFGEF